MMRHNSEKNWTNSNGLTAWYTTILSHFYPASQKEQCQKAGNTTLSFPLPDMPLTTIGGPITVLHGIKLR